jgi:hypothetical protein
MNPERATEVLGLEMSLEEGLRVDLYFSISTSR